MAPPRYRSTRGTATADFREAVLGGLADDGGLLIPTEIPQVDPESLRGLSLGEILTQLLVLYAGDAVPAADAARLVAKSFATFTHEQLTPVVRLKAGARDVHILELFHGPTFAFKDVALQLLGNLFEFFLEQEERAAGTVQPLVVLGATSGDTGSAAIYGLRGKRNVKVFMLHPKGKVSQVQERQMTTILDENVFNIAISDGSFDDAQGIVKALFNDLTFKRKHRLGAVNSINWARILAQISYYFYAYHQVVPAGSGIPVVFSVPTGNFGDVLAGYYAKRMGLPVERLVVASNANDILPRLFNTGKYTKLPVVPTTSPSMDIAISSNLERYLFYSSGEDPAQVAKMMQELKATGAIIKDRAWIERAAKDFWSKRVDGDQIRAVTARIYKDSGYLLDPHSAIGVSAGLDYPRRSERTAVIALATAHPAKFPAAVRAAIGTTPPAPAALAALVDKPTRKIDLPPTAVAVRGFMEAKLGGSRL